ncbi:MAG: Wzt carbohydrate-binding domain-containing protein [Thermoleophilaceae bacterium]|nr:Wzt carbohydrate-binding domain-containing protein [Thermoleophilaceae bacterium]
MSIGDVWVEDEGGQRVDNLGQGERLVIRATLEAERRIEDPELGVTIHDTDNVVVFGTTTRELGREERPLEAGERLRLRVALRNDLRPGRYFVDCGVHERGQRVAAFRRRASGFLVYGNQRQSGLVALEHSFDLQREGSAIEPAGAGR